MTRTAAAAATPESAQHPADSPRPATAGPHIVLVVPRGEAVRNFLYTETLAALSEKARVTVLSVVADEAFLERFRPVTHDIQPLREHPTRPFLGYLRTLTENAHDRWLWSRVHQNQWDLRNHRAADAGRSLKRWVTRGAARLLANPPALRLLTRAEQSLTHHLRPTREFDRLFEEIQPDLVFNGSHIHGLAGELPLRVAQRMGIPTAGFIFSWDNLTSRSRIFVPYDHYLVWHEPMRREMHQYYPRVPAENVHVTGTPQFDFHFQPEHELSREELCQRIGVDPARPYVLYTTGIDNHFFHEHLHVEQVIRLLAQMDPATRPQLVVRMYVKGTSQEMLELSQRGLPDVVFPEVLWEPRWQTPMYEDLPVYTNLLRHAAVGINSASTVTLELMMFGKPVINLDFDPPGTDLPWRLGYERHIRFDHYQPVASSGAVMVARSVEDVGRMLERGLSQPDADEAARRRFLTTTFGATLDGRSGQRVADKLLELAGAGPAR